MAAPGPPQSMPPSSSTSAQQQPPMPTHSDQITWDGDKMFNIYILDYCKKRGYRKTASELVIEADISPESKPPINAQQGLLFEWWSVFWVLFQAKNNGAGSEDAMLYHKHQNQMKLRAGQVPPPGVTQSARYPLPNGVSGPVPSSLPGAHINGIGPGGQPPSLSAPHPYGPGNPAAQPNGIPGPPPAPPGAPGQPFPGGMGGRPPLGPQQRLPNGSQYQSPTIAPSPQSQGNPPQPPPGAMGQLGRSPHMHTINRTAMPPPNVSQHPQGPGPAGSAHPTPTQSFMQLGRPPSSHGVTSQNQLNPHRSPAMAGRMPPGQDRSHMDNIDAEFGSYPPEVISDAKRHAGLGDRDTQSLSPDEKQTILHHVARLRQNPQNSGVAGPSGANTHGQMQGRGPTMQQQLGMPQRIKRNSTSPGEEHSSIPRNEQSPPDRKRPRRTPNPAEQQQQPQQQQQQQQPQQQQPHQQQQQSQPQPPSQQPQQAPQPPHHQSQQPPMAPIGPQPMSGTGPIRGPLPMAGGQPPPNGFGVPQMHQMGMGPGPMPPMHAMSPGMGHGPPMGVINPQQMAQSQVLYQGQFRPGLMHPHKGNPNMQVPLDPQAHLRGPPNRLPGPLVPTQTGQQPKAIGGPMPPPGQPGMGGPPKPGGKEGEGELNAPLNPAASAPTTGPLHNSAPPMNSQRPPSSAQLPTPAPGPPASVPGPIGDQLSFDMTDMFGSTGGDFDFNADMELWFDPSAVHEGPIDL